MMLADRPLSGAFICEARGTAEGVSERAGKVDVKKRKKLVKPFHEHSEFCVQSFNHAIKVSTLIDIVLFIQHGFSALTALHVHINETAAVHP